MADENDEPKTTEERVAIVSDDPDLSFSDAEKGVDEAYARRLGWAPKDEWRGAEERWVDADAFVTRVETEIPVMRERLRAQDSSIAQRDKDIAELKTTIGDFRGFQERSEEKAYNRALKTLRGQQKQAVAEADSDAFDAAAKEIDDLEKDRQASAVAATKPNGAPTEDPEFVPWQGRNSWYGDDVELTAYAEQIAPIVARKTRMASGVALYDAIADEVKKKFPDRFENPRRKQAAPVDGGGGKGHKRARGYGDLPAEAKAACDRFVKQGIMSKDDYVKEFEWEPV